MSEDTKVWIAYFHPSNRKFPNEPNCMFYDESDVFEKGSSLMEEYDLFF